MDGYGITAKSVNHKYIEVLRALFLKLALQGKACIAQDHFDPGRRIPQESEIGICPLGIGNHLRMEFIKPHGVSRTTIRCQSSRPQPNDDDTPRTRLRTDVCSAE